MSWRAQIKRAELILECNRRLLEYQIDNPTAITLNSNECVRCGCCCFNRPGNLDLNDVHILSEHFKLSIKEFFTQYLIIDNINLKWCVLPRRKHQPGGRYIPLIETYDMGSSCVFYENKSCMIHDKKPIICRGMFCNNVEDNFIEYPKWEKEQLMELFGWDGVE